MEEDNYNDILKIFEELPEGFNILEEQIDLEVQTKYFELSKKLRKKHAGKDYMKCRDELFSSEVKAARKKEILIGLARTDDVKAYRTLEHYLENSDTAIRSWAVLALQENRMLIQTSLLDEQQYFISTGLGGKNKKLRYYLVFINRDFQRILTPIQQKLVKEELIFELKHEEGEFESIDFSQGISTSMILLPLQSDIHKIFKKVISECNQYGNFLEEEMLITNVKVLSRSEIIDILKNRKKYKPSPEDSQDDEIIF
ncbi:MAG: hypothetical protein WCY58_07620 [Mariniphaga sp.]|nr:hypothetical protein [Mariniphaga sp.]MDD4225048.1 hypothetical protein [Mariniphaga sp.]MDD4425534.1 hypothetical protein [Mariniphaga sp.]